MLCKKMTKNIAINRNKKNLLKKRWYGRELRKNNNELLCTIVGERRINLLDNLLELNVYWKIKIKMEKAKPYLRPLKVASIKKTGRMAKPTIGIFLSKLIAPLTARK